MRAHQRHTTCQPRPLGLFPARRITPPLPPAPLSGRRPYLSTRRPRQHFPTGEDRRASEEVTPLPVLGFSHAHHLDLPPRTLPATPPPPSLPTPHLPPTTPPPISATPNTPALSFPPHSFPEEPLMLSPHIRAGNSNLHFGTLLLRGGGGGEYLEHKLSRPCLA